VFVFGFLLFFLFFFDFKKKILKVIDDDKLFFINYSHSSFDFFWLFCLFVFLLDDYYLVVG
jgi:hypothetical protein